MADGADGSHPLSDILAPGLDIVFVGINPGMMSASTGHHFAHPRNRFWNAANMGGVFVPPLTAEQDAEALGQGIGFTNIVSRPTPGASDLRTADYRNGALELAQKLEAMPPLIVCFNGVTAYSNYLRFAEGVREKVSPGLQPRRIGGAAVFVVPSPSPANAGFSLDALAGSYQQLAELRRELRDRATSRE